MDNHVDEFLEKMADCRVHRDDLPDWPAIVHCNKGSVLEQCVVIGEYRRTDAGLRVIRSLLVPAGIAAALFIFSLLSPRFQGTPVPAYVGLISLAVGVAIRLWTNPRHATHDTAHVTFDPQKIWIVIDILKRHLKGELVEVSFRIVDASEASGILADRSKEDVHR